jgi:DNA-binding response OmpR family regulator
MKESILIVSHDTALSSTRIELLRRWNPVATTPEDASQALSAQRYDMLILCQTVLDGAARKLIAEARKANPKVRVLAISSEGDDRDLDCQKHQVQIKNPGWLEVAVASLLGARALEHTG